MRSHRVSWPYNPVHRRPLRPAFAGESADVLLFLLGMMTLTGSYLRVSLVTVPIVLVVTLLALWLVV